MTKKGRRASEVLSEALPKEIQALYWAKNMYWRGGKPERFVRPVRWLVAMIDDEVIPLEFAGIKAEQKTYGHRILFPGAQTIANTFQWPTRVSSNAVAIAFGFSAMIGIFFGYYPALQAARLDPIEALRFE